MDNPLTPKDIEREARRQWQWRPGRAWMVLIALALVGVVYFLTIPRWCACERTGTILIRLHLHRLVTAQESFRADSGRYTTNPAQVAYNPFEGVVVTIDTVTATGFRAHARIGVRGRGRPASDTVLRCRVWVGDTTLATPGENDGEPYCPRR